MKNHSEICSTESHSSDQERSQVSAAYQGILREPMPLEDRLTAIYMTSMTEFGGVKNFLRSQNPIAPKGYDEAVFYYNQIQPDKPDKRAAAWKDIRWKFGEYLDKRNSVETQNKSNLDYLKTVLDHFKKHKVMTLRAEIETAIRGYGVEI